MFERWCWPIRVLPEVQALMTLSELVVVKEESIAVKILQGDGGDTVDQA
ncbi:MAG: hypothetical protein GY843_06970 [Neptuniibacter sp.]|nr:hypothetical protein [Neptuniibacter sp.]